MHGIMVSIVKPKHLLVKVMIVLFLGALIVLGALGFLKPIITLLDSESFSVSLGSAKISLYRIIAGLFSLVILLWVARFLSNTSEVYIKRLQSMKASNRALVFNAVRLLIYFIAFLLALQIFGIDPTALAVFGGALGIGIGFGLQKVTSNFISGLILLFEKSVEEGDLLELSDGTLGFLRHTGARCSVIETYDGKEIMIPNEDLMTNRVTNWTYSSSRGRIEVKIGVAYDSDLEKVIQIALDSAKQHPRSSKTRLPECHLTEFGDNALKLTLFFWVDDVTAGRMEPQSDVMCTILKAFREQHIVIPFPQRDVHMKPSE